MTLRQIIFVLFALLCLSLSAAHAQQPFVTDDADITNKGQWHFQFSNEYDLLQRSSYPSLKQNTAIFELDYGLFKGVEIGVDVPVLAVYNAPGQITPQTPFGIGDSTIHLKYIFYKERENSRLPAMALTMNVQFPTGNNRRQLGSGLTDYYLNGVLQKSLSKQTKLRLNGGLLFAGNTVNGVLGIRTRGRVFTGGASVVKQVSKKLDLGAELAGAVTRNFQLSKGQLQGLVGGNYALRKNLTFDFGVVAGRFRASPRAGAQVGISLDF